MNCKQCGHYMAQGYTRYIQHMRHGEVLQQIICQRCFVREFVRELIQEGSLAEYMLLKLEAIQLEREQLR